MGWSNNLVDEVTAPNNVPFLPGNAVTGFGSQVPDELLAAGYPNAIVFYLPDWVATNTTPTVKFRFIAAKNGNIVTGYGWCNNPSVSQVATVVGTTIQGMFINSTPVSDFEFRSHSGVTIFQFTTFGGAQPDPAFLMYDQNGVARSSLFHLIATNTSTFQIANWQLNVVDGASVASVNNPIVMDTAWQTIPLVGGWTGDATRVPLQRRMPDGTVQMKGLITKVANPVNGESWMSANAAAYRPTHTWTFLTATPGRAATTGQVVEIRADGTGVIFDMAVASGVISLDSVRFAVI